MKKLVVNINSWVFLQKGTQVYTWEEAQEMMSIQQREFWFSQGDFEIRRYGKSDNLWFCIDSYYCEIEEVKSEKIQ